MWQVGTSRGRRNGPRLCEPQQRPKLQGAAYFTPDILWLGTLLRVPDPRSVPTNAHGSLVTVSPLPNVASNSRAVFFCRGKM
jgi:hypothetical protein